MGDSLAGRYFLHRLLPLSYSELSQIKSDISLYHLLARGGFPDPLLAAENTEAKRWRNQYVESLLSKDIFDLDNITNVKEMRLLFELLRRRVGSPLSYASLAEDLAISPKTVKRYIQLLESLYVIFIVRPYSNNIARSLLKSPKIYFFDTGLVLGDEGARLENMVAISLLKHCYGHYDYLAEELSLHYLRTKEGHEVDFVLTHDGDVQQMIEVKLSDHTISKSLRYFKEKYQHDAVQVVLNLKQEYQNQGISVLKAKRFLKSLFL